MRTALIVLSAVATMLAASVALAAPVGSSTLGTWQTNGRVNAVEVVGNTAYLGGEFTSLRPAGNSLTKGAVTRDYAAAIDLTTGALLPWNPDANGPVRAIAATGSTVYLGGEFTNVGGSSATRITAVSPDSGKKLAAWQGSASDSVLALAVSGSTVYAGGKFTEANGASHTRIAAFDATSGKPLTTFSASADKVVKSLAVVPGRNQLIIGGSFDSLSGTSRNSIGSLDLTTGAVQAWKPAYPFPVIDVAADGSAVYVAGGGDGGNFVAFDPSTGVVDWRGGTNGNAQAITVTNGVVYVGGHFTTYCGARTGQETCTKATGRKKLLAVDASTGALEPWNPGANSTLGVFALAAGGGTVSAGGDFTQVGSAKQQGFAAFG